MNKKDVNWNDLQLFLAVAREGGLTAASKITGRSAATLGRRMLQLEIAMGCELFARHDRGYELLTDGHQLLAEITNIETMLQRIPVSSNKTKLPLVKVSAGTWTTLALMQKLESLTGSPPDLLLRFVSTEKVLNITHRETSIGFRNQRPTDESLVCRKLSRVEFAPYATPDAPECWIKVMSETPSSRWLNGISDEDTLCEVSSPRNSLDLALSGKGIALLPTFIGDAYSKLVRKGEFIEELSHDQWLVLHHEDRYLPEVRRLLARLAEVTLA